MATAALSSNKFVDKRLEIFCLIWLDANSTVQENQNTEQKLRSIFNQLKKFEDIGKCQEYIEQRSQKDRLVLIVKAVVVKFDELICRISEDYKIQKKVEEPLSINIFTTNTSGGTSTKGVNGEFVFSQVLIDCLLRLKSTEIDKNELINVCQNEYEGNYMELNNLDEFQIDYSSERALWWYTRESFFCKILNTALRTQNIHMIFLFRSFIFDIHSQLQKYQSKQPLQVYRSQMMSNDELKTLQNCIGQFISINTFFSTSIDATKALAFLHNSDSADHLERILFEINADPKIVTTKPFANISQFSAFPNELEVLFMIGSIFRIESINLNYDEIWIIRMTLCSEDEHELKEVLMYMKQQIGSGETNLRILSEVLWKMGKLDLAEEYYKRLLKQLSSNDPLLESLYEDLGELASQRDDFDKSVKWHQKLLAIKNKNPSNINYTNNIIERKINSPPSINIRTKWEQDGITIAGGNGSGDQLNQFFCPEGIYVNDKNQTMYIVDRYNHRVLEWNSNTNIGRVVAGGDGEGKQMNQLNNPTDVIVDEKNNSLIICDWMNSRVVRWSRQNHTNGKTIISNIDCWGLTMDNNGNLYVSDRKKNEVRRWKVGDTNGMIVAGGNGKGNSLNQLHSPTYLFVDENHSVYVSDWENHRVMKWMKDAKEGIIVAGGQGEGNSLAQLSRPAGVFVDQWENVYVADQGNDRIMRWSKGSEEGSIIIGGNGRGNEPNQLYYPTGLSFDEQGNLYVVDSLNERVQKFLIH